jgi:Tfp pilus assembly protein PilF
MTGFRSRGNVLSIAVGVVLLLTVVGWVVVRPGSESSVKRFQTQISAGLTAMHNGDVDAARTAFSKAIKLDPTSAVAHYDLGVLVLQYDANPQAAIDLFTTTLALDPKFTNAQYNRALAYKSLTKFDDAITDLRAVLAVKPDDANVMKKLGELLVQTGKLDEGTALLERAYELDPNLK